MEISSPVFKDGEMLPMKYTCDGKGINPPVVISNIPKGTVSLALIMDDPDAPSGIWTHWTIWNIDPECNVIIEEYSTEDMVVEDIVMLAIEGTTSDGTVGYHGPCPPLGVHHYQFKAYALNSILSLDSSAKKESLEKAMESHVIDQALLVGLYERK